MRAVFPTNGLQGLRGPDIEARTLQVCNIEDPAGVYVDDADCHGNGCSDNKLPPEEVSLGARHPVSALSPLQHRLVIICWVSLDVSPASMLLY